MKSNSFSVKNLQDDVLKETTDTELDSSKQVCPTDVKVCCDLE